MDCKVLSASRDPWMLKMMGGRGQIGGSFSYDSEHDLAAMVSDFLENGSSGTESRYSSDSDSGYYDLANLADTIMYNKLAVDQYESQLASLVSSLILSMKEIDLHFVKSSPCSASCLRFSVVKLLRLSGYDAAVCSSKWQGSGKVPGGEYEYIDVITHKNNMTSERLIIDLDFRSHFEIARAVDTYDRILNSLPVVYAGSLSKLKQYLQVMAEAARSSLKQNSMPLPPWRSLAYLQAKWQSPYERRLNSEDKFTSNAQTHKQCGGHMKRLQTLLQSEIETERLLKPLNRQRKTLSRDAREKFVN